MSKTISILGATGSIGRQTLDVAEQLGLRVAALTAHMDVERLEAQVRKFRPRLAVLTDEAAARAAGCGFIALTTGATLPAVENPSGGRYEAKTIYQALGTQNVDVSALQSGAWSIERSCTIAAQTVSGVTIPNATSVDLTCGHVGVNPSGQLDNSYNQAVHTDDDYGQTVRIAAVNGDDPWTPRLLENVTCPATRFGQGLANDLVGWDAHYCADRVSFTACSDSEHIPVTLHIPGAFSLYNALAALAAAQALGIPIEDAAQALSLCQGVRGRAEVVPTDTDYTVLIDYAHTPDGLKNILSTVCGFADARVLVVFGCGGDRDRTKRAEMGRIAARLADEVIVTSDNPRTENPYAILHEILAGMADSATPFAVLESRREAIAYALDHARTGDVVVLAGKGHETYQVVGAETLPLDERQVVREHLSQ